MLITREADYAMRVLRALSSGEQMTAQAISDLHQVPKPFAYKIIKKLSRAGLVSITRGAEGGCSLSADLDQVTLYDLMQAMEEDFRVIACMEPDYDCTWRNANGACTVHCELAELQRQLDRELRSRTLRSLIFGRSAPEDAAAPERTI
jgi:Rrf2 family protein